MLLKPIGNRCQRWTSTAAGLMLILAASVSAAPNYLTYRYDNMRTGWNPTETTLNTSNVNPTTFGKLWSRPVDGQIYAQPLYMSQLEIPSRGIHNVVFAVTEHNTVYAFDGDSIAPPNDTPLWLTNLGPSVPETVSGCTDIDGPEYGVTSTPVIDATTDTLYVVAKTMEQGRQRYRLHALDVHTGAEQPGWPVLIQGSVPGSGGGNQGGQIVFQPSLQGQRPALLLLNGTVYVAFASHCDFNIDLYHGWVFGYKTSDPTAPPMIYCTSPDAEADSPGAAGIWSSGQGPAADAEGLIYFSTGNGGINVDLGAGNVGDAWVKLRPNADAAAYSLDVTSELQRLDLRNAALTGKPTWRVLAPSSSAAATVQSHAVDYANVSYSDAGVDPYTGATWAAFPFTPGDAGPAGRANRPGGIPDNSTFVLRLHLTIPSSFGGSFSDAHFYLQGFNVDDNNLGTYVNGTEVGSGTGYNNIYRFEVPRSVLHFGGDNVITIMGQEGSGQAGFTISAPYLSAERTYSAQKPAGGLFNGNPDDYYSPSNSLDLDNADADLGSGGVTVLPDQPGSSTPHLLVGVGKDGILRLINRDHMGGFLGRNNRQAPDNAVQDYCCINGGVWGSPGYWQGPLDRYLYVGGSADVLKQFRLSTSNGQTTISAYRSGHITHQFPGPTPNISSHNSQMGTGIVWTNDRSLNVLRAYDAQDVSRTLYDSNMAPARQDSMRRVIKFTVPTPIDGKVYVGGTKELVAYGLRTTPPMPTPASVRIKDVTGTPGEPIQLEVDTDGNAQNVAGVQFTLQFGQALAIPSGNGTVQIGSLIAGPGATAVANPTQPGTLIVGATGTLGQNGPGTLVTIHATVGNVPPGNYTLTLTNLALNDPSGHAIPSSTVNSTLTVLAPEVVVPSITAAPGQTVQVPVNVSGAATGIAGAFLVVQFGPIGTADEKGVKPGTLIGGTGATAVGNAQVPGQITIGAIGTEPMDAPGSLATFPLTINPGTLPGTYPLTLQQASLNDILGADIPVRLTSGTITVLGRIRGDANGDGVVNLGDVVVALRMAIGFVQPTPDQVAALDFNNDGVVDIGDVTRLLAYVVKLIPSL